MKMIRIANGQGFWGDSILGPVRLVREGPIDYLTLDYLAEVTMSIMQKLKQRNPEAGYATDFVEMLERLLPELQEKKIKVIANAGGVNPIACRKAVAKVIKKLREQNKLKSAPIRIGVVTGDDILPTLDSLLQAGEPFKNMDTGAPLSAIRNRVLSANVYIGIEPIVEALRQGADIVIVGRCTDPSLVLAPMVHEFGWSLNDLDKLASGTIAGHIAECGPQCTGGNFTDWRTIPHFASIGYPVVEAYPDGHFVLTKHENTGGLINKATVTSQLVYEMGDPKRYLTPDVIADFTSIQMEEVGSNRLKMSGIRGYPKPETLKVSISYLNGYKTSGQLTIAGPDALEKAKLCTQIIFDRLKMDHCEFRDDQITVEYLGTAVCHAGIASMPNDLPEVVLRIGVKDDDEDKVDRFGKEIAPVITSGPPGVTGFSGGRPKATEIVGYWPALVSRQHIQIRVNTEEA